MSVTESAVGAVAAPAIARAQTTFNWKMTSFYGPNAAFYSTGPGSAKDLIKRIEENGGKMRMRQVRSYFPGEKPYRMAYCEDPFGNIVEIYSHSYELTYSAGAYV